MNKGYNLPSPKNKNLVALAQDRQACEYASLKKAPQFWGGKLWCNKIVKDAITCWPLTGLLARTCTRQGLIMLTYSL